MPSCFSSYCFLPSLPPRLDPYPQGDRIQQVCIASDPTPLKNWTRITMDEMKGFLMGIIKKPTVAPYWPWWQSTNKTKNYHILQQVYGRHRLFRHVFRWKGGSTLLKRDGFQHHNHDSVE
jgi:hypothetical protein